VRIVGSIPHPDEAFMAQVTRTPAGRWAARHPDAVSGAERGSQEIAGRMFRE